MNVLRNGGGVWGSDVGDDDERELTAAERQALIKQQVARLQTDPFSTKGEDKEFRDYVGDAYRHVYGSNDERRQAGLRDDATPLRADLPPFRPNPQTRHALLDAPVGPTLIAPNKFADVANVQRLLSGAGRYVLDMRNEQGGVYSGTLERAIKAYQRDNDLAEDGVLLPNGPTVTALKRELFGGTGRAGRAGRTGPTAEAGDERKDAPQLARHIDPAATRIHDGHVPNFLQASDPGARRKERGDERDDAQDDRRSAPPQLAQNEPEKRSDPTWPPKVGDLRRKDADDLARMGYGPGVWLPDRSDPTGDRILRFDLQTMRPISDSHGNVVSLSKREVADDPDGLRLQREFFTWDELAALKLNPSQKAGIGQRLQKLMWPAPDGGERFWDPEGFGHFGALREDETGKVREHEGYDIASKPDSDIVSPIHGRITVINRPKVPDGMDPEVFRRTQKQVRPGIAIEGTGENAGILIVLEYTDALASLNVGASVSPGQKVGILTPMLRFYSPRAQTRMKNHLHLEVFVGGKKVDPRLMMVMPEP